ncbi:hypothetical protein CEP54_006132 [Fusarium duplospermum]|uniref:Uncharacterized protein n=1 Tax=Fusarium duplospermum TaxID=1325734 RepID=A0A428Q8G8_9HYPO|nr:hypothetical protein CEP54_006132 [Fusarium duplospermum]
MRGAMTRYSHIRSQGLDHRSRVTTQCRETKIFAALLGNIFVLREPRIHSFQPQSFHTLDTAAFCLTHP